MLELSRNYRWFLTLCWVWACCFGAAVVFPTFVGVALAGEAVQPPADQEPVELDLSGGDEGALDDDEEDEEDEDDGFSSRPSSKPDLGGSDELREEVFGADILVRQRRPFLRKYRVGLVPAGIINTNDALQTHIGFGGTVRYHWAERHSIGARFMTYVNSNKPLREQLQQDLSVFPERTDISYDTALVYAFSPIDGKFSLFGSGIAHYDVYGQIGGGMVDTFTAMNPSVIAGLGWRIYLTGWLALEFEVNDTAFFEPYPSGKKLVHHMTFGLGAALYLPFNPRYRSGR